MSRLADFRNFCQDNELNSDKDFAWDAFRREELRLPWGEERGGDCPECGKHSVKVNGARWFCYYCPARGMVPNGVELTPKQQEAERTLRKEQQARNQKKAFKIWDDSERITGSNTQVHTYFRARGLSLEPIPDLYRVMRWHRACPYGKGTEPCIVSLFRDALTDEPTAIHRVHIADAPRGKKDEPMALGPIAGSAIKLWPLASDQESLTIGEGIENVLSAVELKKGSPPAWAATVANNLSRIPVVPGVKRLIIAADNDANGEGQKCADILRLNWRYQGKKVVITKPNKVKDFNDLLLRIRGRS